MLSIRTFYRVLLFAIILALFGCGASDTYPKAQAGVKTFHDLLDSGDYSKIYDSSGSDFKGATTPTKLKEFLGAVHTKLGRVLNSTQVNFNVAWMNGVTKVQLQETTHFENATATEQFYFTNKDGAVLLQGYHIQSDYLITH